MTINSDPRTLAVLAVTVAREPAQDVGALAYQARLFAQTSLPYRNPGDVPAWGRNNGGLSLAIQPGGYVDQHTHEWRSVGFPYGVIPRLLLAWLCTEAVRTKSRSLFLGDTLAEFMAELGMTPNGGVRGGATRLRDQMERLFLARIICRYEDSVNRATAAASFAVADGCWLWWDPKEPNLNQGVLLPSTVSLSEAFYEQVTTRPVPIDMRVLRGIRRSPLALDIYTWLTHRLSYLRRPSHISWAQVQAQFGSNFQDTKQGRRKFRLDFEKQLAKVLAFYRDARVATTPEQLVLLPSRPHVSPRKPQ